MLTGHHPYCAHSPHADKQAEDRAYRIGQLRDVTVIKLICKNSVEEMMRELADKKLRLDSEVSGADENKTKSSLLRGLKEKFTGELAASTGAAIAGPSGQEPVPL